MRVDVERCRARIELFDFFKAYLNYAARFKSVLEKRLVI